MFDAHNHLQRFTHPDEVIATMREVGVATCVVNGTSEEDWHEVARLAEDYPDFVLPAFGLHPWFVSKRSSDWLDVLQTYLDRFPEASVGECGLDRWIDEPGIDEQFECFLPQIRLARENGRALTIHALKAWGPLMEAFEREDPPSVGFLMHSFGGSLEVMKRLLDLGARFSFSGYFLHPRKATLMDVFRQIPTDRLLIETDAPDMPLPDEFVRFPTNDKQNHPANLISIASALSDRLGQAEEDLCTACSKNAQSLFVRSKTENSRN